MNMNDQEKAVAFYREIKKDVAQFIPVALCVIGEGMLRTNAEKMNADVECTLDGKKYKVKAKFSLSPL